MNPKKRIAVISPKVFFGELSKGEVPPVVLFINCKGGMWERAITRLREEVLGSQWNMHYAELEGKEVALSELSNRLLTTPFMGARRMVVVKGVEDMWKSATKQREEVLKFISSYKGKNLLVLAADGDLGLLSPSPKAHPLAEAASQRGSIVTLKPKNREELRQWIERELQRAKIAYDPAFVEWLMEESGGNVGFVESEIEKRILTMEEEEELSTTVSLTRFKREIALGDPKALSSMDELLAQGHPPLYLMGILTNLVRNAVAVYEEGKKARSIEVGFQRAKVYRSEREAVKGILKRYPKGRIYNLFPLLQEADKELKSSSTPPRIVLGKTLVSLIGR